MPDNIIRNTINNIDCIAGMRGMADESVDMILCDPPYAMTSCGWGKPLDLAAFWAECRRVIKQRGVIAIFGIWPFTGQLVGGCSVQHRYPLYWLKTNKTGHLCAKIQPMRRVEEVHIFYKKSGQYYPQGLTDAEPARVSKRAVAGETTYRNGKLDVEYVTDGRSGYPDNVLCFASDVRVPGERLHPTQKPVALCEYLIRTYTLPGMLVLDPTAGSGTTAVAAANTGRDYVCFDTDAGYCETARSRVAGNA